MAISVSAKMAIFNHWYRADHFKRIKEASGICTPFDKIEVLPNYQPISDRFRFDFVVVRHGKFRLLFGAALEEAKKGREIRENKWRRIKRSRVLRPPSIQGLLQKAHQYNWRLKANPTLKRNRLAAEIGVAPSFLTRILRLVNLAPEIQDHIKQMPPTLHPSPITESRLRVLARSEDHGFQISEFDRLKSLGSRF